MYINHIRYINIKLCVFIHIALFTVNHFCYSNNRFNPENVLQGPEKKTNFWAPNVKSVKVYKTGFELNQPVIELNTDETITIEFDDLSESAEQLEYTVLHCDFSWQPTNLAFMEYADGFEFNPLYDYQYSSGTLIPYRHYTLTLPSKEFRFKVSGNYVVQVMKQGNRNDIVLQLQIRVYEPLVNIDALMRQPVAPNFQRTYQQMELTLNTSPLGKVDFNTDIVAIVNQNNQPYDELVLKSPQFVDGSKLTYHTSTTPIFEGGNEFRQLNLKSFHYQTAEVENIQQIDGSYQVILNPAKSVKSYRYTENRDINGKYIIKCDDVAESSTQADYAWVYFTLDYDIQPDGDIYLFGELTGWGINPNFKMDFNSQKGLYEKRLLLKQGFYNYKYVFMSNKGLTPDFNRIESNFYDTENAYNIFVFYKSQGSRYWRLVGFQGINSRYR